MSLRHDLGTTGAVNAPACSLSFAGLACADEVTGDSPLHCGWLSLGTIDNPIRHDGTTWQGSKIERQS